MPNWVPYDFDEIQEGTPFLLPWKERAAINEELLAGKIREWRDLLNATDVNTARDIGYISICGASGVGKTRTGMQLPMLLKKHLDNSYVIQTFCRSDKMPQANTIQPSLPEFQLPADDHALRTAAGEWLCRQLASFFLPSGTLIPLLELRTILEKIRSVYSVPAESSLVIFFQIDEFQDRHIACTHLLRYIGALFRATGQTNPFKASNTLLVPVLTGTWLGPLVLATELVDLKLLLVGLDSPEDAHSLFTDYLKSSTLEQSKLIPAFEDAHHRHTLAMLGYVPRLILIYADVFQSNPCDLSNPYAYKKMWKNLQTVIASSYNPSDLTRAHKDHVLALWYFATPVTPLYDLSGGLTIHSLMRYGVLFLTKQTNGFTVAVPLVIARIWKREFFDLDSFIDPRVQLAKTDFPRFILTIHQLTYRMMGLQADLYAILGDKAAFKRLRRLTNQYQTEVLTSVSEIYNYAIEGSKAILDRPLWIQPNIELLPKGRFDPSVYGLCESPDRAAGAVAVTPHAAEQYKSFMAFAKGGAVTFGAILDGTAVVAELNKDFYGRELLAIITPKTISGVQLVQDQYYQINHGPEGLHPSRAFPRPADAPLALGPIPLPGSAVAAAVVEPAASSSKTDRLLILHTEAKLDRFARGLMSFEQLEMVPKKTTTTVKKKKKKEEEEIEPEVPEVEEKNKKRAAPTQASDDEDGEVASKKSNRSADDE